MSSPEALIESQRVFSSLQVQHIAESATRIPGVYSFRAGHRSWGAVPSPIRFLRTIANQIGGEAYSRRPRHAS